MNYDVVLTTKAERQLRAAADWWEAHRSAEEASRWFNGFVDALQALSRNPDRCSRAGEDGRLSIPLWELHFGLGRKATHRAIFTIRPDRVVVYAIRHVAQRDVTPDDL